MGIAVACDDGASGGATLQHTSSPTATAELAWWPTPPGPEAVELVAYVGNDGNIWTISPDASAPRQVTTNGDNAQPAWSPDGSTLVYIHSRREVYLVKADGTDERQVPHRDHCAEPFGRYGLGSARLTRVQFTPDGLGLRIGIDWGGVTNQFICHLVLDNSGSPLATVQGDEFGVNPQDGTIARTRSGQGCAWMYVIGPGEVDERQVGPTMGVGCPIEPVELSVYPYAPTWSPDGRSIAFYGVDLSSRGTGLYTLNVGDTALAQLLVEAGPAADVQGGALGLAWSPDGRFLAYEKDGSVWTIELATSATRKIVDGSNPAWRRVPSEYLPQADGSDAENTGDADIDIPPGR